MGTHGYSFAIDETNNRYGHLVVKARASNHMKASNKQVARWLCQCDCGNASIVAGQDLRSGHTKSCGCRNGLPREESAIQAYYRSYIKAAKRRNLSFDIDLEFFRRLTRCNCYYCGAEPRFAHPVSKRYDAIYINGIDRIENDKGYTKNNLVPCCGRCNNKKRSMPFHIFIEHINIVRRIST